MVDSEGGASGLSFGQYVHIVGEFGKRGFRDKQPYVHLQCDFWVQTNIISLYCLLLGLQCSGKDTCYEFCMFTLLLASFQS